MVSSKLIKITGIVQGVGFRPYIYNLANKLNLNGWVLNDSNGVEIHIEGENDSIKNFIDRIKLSPTTIYNPKYLYIRL